MKCKNCRKLKKNHHSDKNDMGKRYWCHPLDKFKPGDKEYTMKFEEATQNTGRSSK